MFRLGFLYSFVSRLSILIFFAVPALWAQTEASTGVISGTVHDQSGTVVVGVAVKVTHVQTGLTREAASNENGYYRFSLLPLGDYVLETSNSGFASMKRTGIKLGVGQELVVDVTMQL
jgi:hypothetical protein